ncbi:SIR2 family protein [Paenibacillus sp. FSL R5-0749]|uniref:SIR2 family protein n=1 Tax=Paenibacillus sp. FSL R5-0749 TaxID=2921657 RepID=UPI00315A2EEC
MRVTALLGAGASVDIGGPLSTHLTRIVRETPQRIYDFETHNFVEYEFLEEVSSELDNFFSPSICHFEDVFYTLESLISFARLSQSGTMKKFKPHLGGFLVPSNTNFFNQELLQHAKRDLITQVSKEINNYSVQYDPREEHSWFASFWENATSQCHWDISTLNYDNCMEVSISEYEDGFENEIEGEIFKRFNPKKLLNNHEKTRIMHLHGSILYGHLTTSDNRNIFEDDFHDLYLYPTFEDAYQTWFNQSSFTAQSHDEAHIGPIITGLKKTDKLLPYPYSTYYFQLQKSLLENDRLLIIGYSFGDYHINSLLERVIRNHGESRKIVIISYFPNPSDWCPDISVMGWPENEMLRFIAKAFKEAAPFSQVREYKEKIESVDGRAQIYLGGVKDTFEKYGSDIIHFLTN